MSNRDEVVIERIRKEPFYVKKKFTDIEKDYFMQDEDLQHIVAMAFITIGECVNRLSEEFREAYPQIPWYDIIAVRNIAAHGYWSLDMDAIWEALESGVPELMEVFGVA